MNNKLIIYQSDIKKIDNNDLLAFEIKRTFEFFKLK